MRKIKIFLASSSELKDDREQFEIFINRKNKELQEQDIFLRLELWEDFFDAMSAEGLQSEYNKVVRESDIFVLLAQNKIGKYTAEEFEQAFGQFSEKSKPFIYTYFKPPTTRDREETQSLWAFEDKLKELKHYKTEYKNISELREHFSKQLSKLISSAAIFSTEKAEQVASQDRLSQPSVPRQMPPLPDHFVERSVQQQQVKADLLREGTKAGTLVVSAIYGLGGIGKSVLAAKLAREPEVQTYFSDGILWATPRPESRHLTPAEWLDAGARRQRL